MLVAAEGSNAVLDMAAGVEGGVGVCVRWGAATRTATVLIGLAKATCSRCSRRRFSAKKNVAAQHTAARRTRTTMTAMVPPVVRLPSVTEELSAEKSPTIMGEAAGVEDDEGVVEAEAPADELRLTLEVAAVVGDGGATATSVAACVMATDAKVTGQALPRALAVAVLQVGSMRVVTRPPRAPWSATKALPGCDVTAREMRKVRPWVEFAAVLQSTPTSCRRRCRKSSAPDAALLALQEDEETSPPKGVCEVEFAVPVTSMLNVSAAASVEDEEEPLNCELFNARATAARTAHSALKLLLAKMGLSARPTPEKSTVTTPCTSKLLPTGDGPVERVA